MLSPSFTVALRLEINIANPHQRKPIKTANNRMVLVSFLLIKICSFCLGLQRFPYKAVDDSSEASPISPIAIDVVALVRSHVLQFFGKDGKGFGWNFSKIFYLFVFIDYSQRSADFLK